MVLSIVIIIAAIALVAVLFIQFSPQFGGKASDEAIATYKTSKNYKEGVFKNTNDVKLDMSLKDMGKALIGFFKSQPNTKPDHDLPLAKIDSLNIVNYKGDTRLVWFGHSTFLLQTEGKTILIDPMLGNVPAPHPMLGGKRFNEDLPITIEQLPKIDAVLISHDHYDHLDYESIKVLKDKVEHFFTPLGVGAHLQKWEVDNTKITELDWWQETTFKELKLVCAPAQHFSGRGLTDRAKTLWSSWIVQSKKDNIFFSGDSGYANHFKEIGEKYGPFDFAMIECGQYNEMWPEIHMFPEETVQAGIDVKAKKVMPIHWGAFKLAMHTWTDPIERFTKTAKEFNVNMVTPKIGDEIFPKDSTYNTKTWWQ
ncbi:MBL fold metallo-hydrolase [Winogradskyella echinorum]|uniref:MBL fold metallo-hydrolase n=2 Tax=Winogradskyella echinorum TaxID=538189 RepID=A0ABR6Y0T6_9FLAO|nr:MBL fold metallo-hydrolase [Winogradskyella echinorum]MBC5750689.1 MBL fold metallo-hydrolase [Winogradskyella echinorum]